jgi:flagellar biosynthesis protein FlhB
VNEAGEKPFEATPHRLVKAKREGNVARSSEFAANISFAAAAWTAIATAPLLGAVACSSLAAAASNGIVSRNSMFIVAPALLSLGAATLAGALASLLQTGGLTFVAVAPKMERLNPMEGLKRVCSRDTLAHSARATLAFVCATAAMLPLIGVSAATMLCAAGFGGVAMAAWTGAHQVSIAAVAVGLLFSIAEYGAARSAWLRKLRMSFEERKREAKDEEGDAVARGRRRTLHRALVRGGLHRLKSAAFVVANPTHVAVALEYGPPAVPVPRAVVRAADELASRVVRLARSYRIPVVENVTLARALYRDTRIGEPIPHAHYVAVAEVVAALLRALEIAG